MPDPSDPLTAPAAREFLTRMTVLCGLGPVNAAYVLMQCPAATRLASVGQWRLWGRQPRPGEAPVVYLTNRRGPLAFVFDISQMRPVPGEKRQPLPPEEVQTVHEMGDETIPADLLPTGYFPGTARLNRFVRQLPEIGLRASERKYRPERGDDHTRLRVLPHPLFVRPTEDSTRVRGVVAEIECATGWEELSAHRRLWEMLLAVGRAVQKIRLPEPRNVTRHPRAATGLPGDLTWSLAEVNMMSLRDRWVVEKGRFHDTDPDAVEFTAHMAAFLTAHRLDLTHLLPPDNPASRFLADDSAVAPRQTWLMPIVQVTGLLTAMLRETPTKYGARFIPGEVVGLYSRIFGAPRPWPETWGDPEVDAGRAHGFAVDGEAGGDAGEQHPGTSGPVQPGLWPEPED